MVGRSIHAQSEYPWVWSASTLGTLSYFEWDDEDRALLFDPNSGATHLLDSAALEILKALSSSALRVEELVELISPLFEVDDTIDLSHFVHEVLLKLLDAALVSRSPT